MTVLMTSNQPYMLESGRCRIEWQGLGEADEVSARFVADQGPASSFPHDAVAGLRQQPFSPKGTWLLDLTAVDSGVRRIDVVVEPRATSVLSLAIEVAGAVGS